MKKKLLSLVSIALAASFGGQTPVLCVDAPPDGVARYQAGSQQAPQPVQQNTIAEEPVMAIIDDRKRLMKRLYRPQRNRDDGFGPKEYGELLQAAGRQKWTKRKK